MASEKGAKEVCLCTIITPDFMAGALVMLHSFFEHNDWFKGDILIYGEGLRPEDKELLSLFPNIKYLEPDPEVQSKIEDILVHRPELAYKKMVFYSLNLFNLPGYDKYFYIDSDAFFNGSIEELVHMDHGLMCSLDFATYKGFAKNGETFELEREPDDSDIYWHRTFNAGILFIDKKLVNRAIFEDLLALLAPENYIGLKRPTTDQYLLNQYFRESFHALPGIYNYRINISPQIQEKEGFSLNDAKIIHFPGPKNPWMAHQVIDTVAQQPLYLEPLKMWHTAYLKMLSDLRTKAQKD